MELAFPTIGNSFTWKNGNENNVRIDLSPITGCGEQIILGPNLINHFSQEKIKYFLLYINLCILMLQMFGSGVRNQHNLSIWVVNGRINRLH